MLACDNNSTVTTPVTPEQPSPEWVTRTARGTPDPDLLAVCWNEDNGSFYCGGGEEITMESPNGDEWELRGSNGSGRVVGVASLGSAVIQVNSDGRILCETCRGGRLAQYNWSPAAVAANFSLAVVVGADGHVVTHDGLSQTEHETGIGADFTDVTWDGASSFIASASDGVLRRSVDGATWTPFSDTHAGRLRSVAAKDPAIVALGEAGQVLKSRDRGVSWQTADGLTGFQDVIWSGNEFMAVGDKGNVLIPNAMGGWRTISTGVDKTLRSVALGRVLVAVGDAGTIVTSSDGITWEQRQPGRWLDFDDVIWTGTRFLACASVLPGVMPAYLSSDGIAWSPVISVEDPYSIDRFSKVAWSGTRAIASADGIAYWWNGEHAFARVYSSDDLQHWRIVAETHDSYYADNVIWLNNEFFVVCSDEVLRSPDGENWISEPTANYSILSAFIGVTVRDQTAYGMTMDGRLFTSSSLTSWHEIGGMNLPGVKMDITWTGSGFLACGYNTTKHVWWSSDLSTWEAMDPNTGFDLFGAAGSSERWVVVGRNGTIRTLDR